MIYLFAPDQRQAEWWCKHNDTPINPRDRRAVRIFTPSTDVRGLMGNRFEEGDRVVIYNSAGISRHQASIRQRWSDLMFNLSMMEGRSNRTFANREYVR